MSERLIYSISTGRCGTVFLTRLLEANLGPGRARVFHERTGFPHFGVDTPDASHFTTFNTAGNLPNVEAFFRRKLERDLATPEPVHVEVSHFLAKAGLVENLSAVADRARIDLVALRRDPFRIAWSFINRFDFYNTGFTWLFSLDPRYPNVIVPSAPFRERGMFGAAVWYVAEMFARIAYYRRLVTEELPGVSFHEVALEEIVTPAGAAKLLRSLDLASPGEELVLPAKQNETKQEFFGEKEAAYTRRIFEELWGDPAERGREFHASGRRLGQVAGARSGAGEAAVRGGSIRASGGGESN